MDHHVAEETARNLDIGDRWRSRIERGDRQQFSLADFTRFQRLLEPAEIRIKAPVEPDHDRLVGPRHLLLAGACPRQTEIDRLLAQNRLARSNRRFDQIRMRIRRSRDQDGVNRRVGDDVFGRARSGVVLSGEFLRVFRIEIRNRHQFTAGIGGNGGCMDTGNTACTEKSDFQHCCLPWVRVNDPLVQSVIDRPSCALRRAASRMASVRAPCSAVTGGDVPRLTASAKAS